MRITCPQCGFFREVADAKIPVTSTMATCPKCAHRFKFRGCSPTRDELSRTPPPVRPAPAREDEAPWRREEAAQSAPEMTAERNPPPSARWEPEAEVDRAPAEEPAEPAAPEAVTAGVPAAPPDRPEPAEDRPAPPPPPKAEAPVEDKAADAPGLGADGVRDIWARLQAMGGDEEATHAGERPGAAPGEEEPTEAAADPVPWERLDLYGFFPGLFLTLRKVLFQPVDFFEAMPPGRQKGKGLVFNLLISEFLLVIDFMWSLFGLRARLTEPGTTETMGQLAATPGLTFLAMLLLVPVVLAVGVYLDAWLTHLLLLLFRCAKKGFNETFRVMCYSAAPTVLSAVPVAGQILSPVILIWYMTLQAIGLKKVHEGAYTQTLAAVFIKWSLYLFLLLAVLQSFSQGR